MAARYEPLASSPFLHLPREIRDRIYHEVLDLHVTAAEYPEEGDRRGKEENEWGCVYHEYRKPQVSSLGLLGCNHQISGEMREAIKRKDESVEAGIAWELDLMIWEECIKPTWLAVPVLAKQVKLLQLCVRVIVIELGRQGQYVFQILRRFFRYGSDLTRGPRDYRLPLRETAFYNRFLRLNITLANVLLHRSIAEAEDSHNEPLRPRDPMIYLRFLIDQPCGPDDRSSFNADAPNPPALESLKGYLGNLGTMVGQFLSSD